MAMQEPNTQDFITSFKGFMDKAVAQVPAKEPIFLDALRTHFGTEPKNLPTVKEKIGKADHPNLHLALTSLLAREGWRAELRGFVIPYEHMGIKFSSLLSTQQNTEIKEGPVEYVNIMLHDDQVLVCVQTGLYFIYHHDRPLALLLRGIRDWGMGGGVEVDVMASELAEAENFLAELRTTMRTNNVYRSHVISLSKDNQGVISVQFHHLPQTTRDNIILPAGVLDRIERQTITFAKLSEKLKAAGRHIKRGILLYGAPGTGKTLTAMYLASQMPERTIILLTGRSIGLLEQSCRMARLLQPATVILEDVDLIAEERTRQEVGCNALLFELLNQMDGLADDADVLFLLTTNRPDILEPALAARPGRIDQAIEVPLPDRTCRQRLFDLYGQGLTLQLEQLPQLIDQTEGVSAAFIRELMRKAALFAADENDDLIVEDRHIEEALHELVFEGGELTKRLLGATRAF
ncbi:MAG TPA: ATP-binding protein [Ktedonosporobacter sp.]|jgi:AAA+ superfamily predicted ATPase|nr:ATP-binding protein [Ktedonosporobacter sp.]